MTSNYQQAIQQYFRPEFINRIDQIVEFNPLSRKDLAAIIKIRIEQMNRELSQEQIRIKLTPGSMRYFVEMSMRESQYGARPLQRLLQEHVEDALAEAILRGQVKPGNTVVVKYSVKNGIHLKSKSGRFVASLAL